jgi:hypothetical protein
MAYFAAAFCVAWLVCITGIAYATYREMKAHNKNHNN